MNDEEKKKEEPGTATADAVGAPDEKAPEESAAGDVGGEELPKEEPPASGDRPDEEASATGQDEPSEEKAEPDWKDMYARTLADFDNYRKRTSRDREELVKFAASDAIKDMLPTADNLMLALDQAKDKDDPFVKGVKLAYDGLLKALKDHGAEPFESLGETLDPNIHDAIATLPSDTVEEGRIANEVKKGWMLNGRLLRAAQVVVSSGKAK